ncbi:MAG: hypothetical protein U1D67_01340 [Dehalococcoidia bacterium]|nr:hypothetical protein [Dehalococcoidia bacterium]
MVRPETELQVPGMREYISGRYAQLDTTPRACMRRMFEGKEVAMIHWDYANSYGELPQGEAEKVEALVKIAEQLDRIADALEGLESAKDFDQTVRLYAPGHILEERRS